MASSNEDELTLILGRFKLTKQRLAMYFLIDKEQLLRRRIS